jgi:uncharacterized protein (TIGR02246 family)
MSLRRLLTSLAVALPAFAAGAVWGQTSSPVTQIFQAQVAALNANDSAKYAATYTDDAIVMNQEQPLVKGKAAIQRDSEDQIKKNPTKDPQMQGRVLQSDVSGDLGYVAYAGSHIVRGSKRTWHGVTVYRRVGGEWKAIVDASSYDTPPPAK